MKRSTAIAAGLAICLLVLGGVAAVGQEPQQLVLKLRTQELRQHDWGGSYWHTLEASGQWQASETALVICDVWDKHWSQGATRRVGELAPRMNIVVQANIKHSSSSGGADV